MKFILTWLMVFCVLAGLNARVLADHAVRSGGCSPSETCCESTQDGEKPADHQDDGDDCPLEHHHHHDCCSQTLPLAVDNTIPGASHVPGSSLLGLRPEGDVPPEGPFLGSEKPPLI
jgi:hypothetical protein